MQRAEQISNDNDTFKDVCSWNGIKCDAIQDVIEVELSRGIDGELMLGNAPRSTKRISVQYKFQARGTLDSPTLPHNLAELSIISTKFSGEVDMTLLPESLKIFEFISNEFCGRLNLTMLLTDCMRLLLYFRYFQR